MRETLLTVRPDAQLMLPAVGPADAAGLPAWPAAPLTPCRGAGRRGRRAGGWEMDTAGAFRAARGAKWAEQAGDADAVIPRRLSLAAALAQARRPLSY